MIIYVKKEDLHPAFGIAKNGNAYVREDLPEVVKKFVAIHEQYHLQDKSTNWFWREVKANCYAGVRKPIGLMYTLYLSLSSERLKMYIQRFKDKK
jgi:hypothetical protein